MLSIEHHLPLSATTHVQLAFVEAAQKSGVKHIVKLSQFAALANSPVRFLRYHAAVEAAIQASGMDYFEEFARDYATAFSY